MLTVSTMVLRTESPNSCLLQPVLYINRQDVGSTNCLSLERQICLLGCEYHSTHISPMSQKVLDGAHDELEAIVTSGRYTLRTTGLPAVPAKAASCCSLPMSIINFSVVPVLSQKKKRKISSVLNRRHKPIRTYGITICK